MCINCIHTILLPTVVDAMLHVFMVLSALYHRLFLFLLLILGRHSACSHWLSLHFTLWRFWHFCTFLLLSLSHSRSLRFFFFLISVVTVAVMLLLHIFSDFFSQHRLWLSIHAYKRIIACLCFSFSHRQMCAAKRKSIALTRSPYPLNTEHRTEQPMHDFTVKY